MKNARKSLFIAILLSLSIVATSAFIIATPAFAQEATSTPSTRDQYHSALLQLISLLEQEVQSLMTQLQAVQSNQSTMQTQVQTIVQNTTPAPVQQTQPVFGGISAPIPTNLIVSIDSFITSTTTSDPHGQIEFRAKVQDQNGNDMKGQQITIIRPNDDLFVIAGPNSSDVVQTTANLDGANKTSYTTGGFEYIPGTSGEHQITFTSGNLSTTTIVEVQ